MAAKIRIFDDADQHRLHELLYRFKQNEPLAARSGAAQLRYPGP